MAELNAALASTPERRNGNINLSKYFISSRIEPTTSRFYSHTLYHCATTGLCSSFSLMGIEPTTYRDYSRTLVLFASRLASIYNNKKNLASCDRCMKKKHFNNFSCRIEYHHSLSVSRDFTRDKLVKVPSRVIYDMWIRSVSYS